MNQRLTISLPKKLECYFNSLKTAFLTLDFFDICQQSRKYFNAEKKIRGQSIPGEIVFMVKRHFYRRL